jgi:hypothetical protein
LERAAARATKEALCAQAEVVALTWPGAKARPEMARLLEQWKTAGHASKAEDKALWSRFNQAQDLLFTRLDLERGERQAAMAAAQSLKEGLCETAERLATRADTRQAAETMKSLVAQWQEAGHAGRDEGALWRRFKAAQDQLFGRIRDDRKSAEAGQREVAAAKQALVDDVEALIGAPDLAQAKAEMKRLADAFHAAGYAGRDANRKLSQAFSDAQTRFWAWVRPEPARRRASGEQATYGKRARLVQQADRLKRDIARSEAELALAAPGPAAKKPRGGGVTLNLTAAGAGTSLAAVVMRLRLRLAETEEAIYRLDQQLT